MSKKFLATVALVIASIFVLAGCSGESYKFTALSDNPSVSDEVRSNGGIYVEKGKYSYFINAAENGVNDNTFGKEHAGSIVRCLTDKLTDKNRVVEVVVPKIIYAEDAKSAGFYIFGDRIYYVTPNNSKDTHGNVQFSKLDFMSVKLDGTDTQFLGTMDDIKSPYIFVENNNNVYVLYEGKEKIKVNDVDTEVKALFQLDTKTKTVTTIDNDIASYSFDYTVGGKSVAYTKTQRIKISATDKEEVDNRYNVLYNFVAGSEKATVVKDGKLGGEQFQVMTVETVNNNVIFYTFAQTGNANKGLVKVKDGQEKMLAPTQYKDFVPMADQDIIFVKDGNWIKKVDFTGANLVTTLVCAESSEIEFDKIVGNYLFFEKDDALFFTDITKENQLTSRAVEGMMKSTVWASFDYVLREGGDFAVFYFNDREDITFANYLYMDTFDADAEGENKVVSKRIGKLSTYHQEQAQKNGDDKYAVDKIN